MDDLSRKFLAGSAIGDLLDADIFESALPPPLPLQPQVDEFERRTPFNDSVPQKEYIKNIIDYNENITLKENFHNKIYNKNYNNNINKYIPSLIDPLDIEDLVAWRPRQLTDADKAELDGVVGDLGSL